MFPFGIGEMPRLSGEEGSNFETLDIL
jgi:hypothetical protein